LEWEDSQVRAEFLTPSIYKFMQTISRTFVLLLLFATLTTPSYAQDIEVYDPIEPVNRGIFWFNDQVDVYFLEPVAKGYKYVTPKFFRTGVSNFFGNLRYPSLLVSDLVQLKFDQAATHTGRFLINSTLGLAGLFDVAEEFGLEKHEEDFGTALGYHGVAAGPYLVIPILGPSNVRDGIGRIVDLLLDPFFYLSYTDMETRTANSLTYGSYALRLINTRAEMIEGVESAKEGSVDYYLFIQGAYTQHRRNLIYDNNPPRAEGENEEEEDLYDSDIQDIPLDAEPTAEQPADDGTSAVAPN